MFDTIKRFFIGRPLKNTLLGEQTLTVFWGLPILASDAISSVAYAAEEILIVLVPVFGLLAYTQLAYISAAIIGLLIILVLSYLQTIEKYPNGGGAYIVAKENLGVVPGVTAGASLSIGYIVTVAVSICAGTAAIVSAFPVLVSYKVTISLVLLLLVLWGNLRGVRESSHIFSFPTYAFVLAILAMLGTGLIKYWLYGAPDFNYQPTVPVDSITGWMALFLILKAFSSGCTALTGVEAVSNAVPNFKEPGIKRAQTTLILLGVLVFVLFGGTTLIANIYHVIPIKNVTVLSQIGMAVFGHNFMFYFLQIATAFILIMAANTAYSGFPMLVSVMAQDGFLPRQLSNRGDRLNYTNGILALTFLSAVLIIAFQSDVHLLLPLYALGVFLSFTLSQSGMLKNWLTEKGDRWRSRAVINGAGALVTALVVVTIGLVKFTQGAWIVVVIIPIMVIIMRRIKEHYNFVIKHLLFTPTELNNISLGKKYRKNIVIVPIESFTRSSVRALQYARTISTEVVAFHICIDKQRGHDFMENWKKYHTDIKLIVKYSPFRKLTRPLLKYIEFLDKASTEDDIITVVLPKFSVKTWWEIFLHNQTKILVQNSLMQRRHIVVATIPLHLD